MVIVAEKIVNTICIMEILTLIANVALPLSFVIAAVFGLAQVNTQNRDGVRDLK